MSRGTPARALALLAALALALAAAALASAELTQRGDLFLAFQGGISPNALPRRTPAPVAVTVAGRIRTLGGARPPALRRIQIAINRGGRLDTAGLAICPAARIRSTTTKAALAACRGALVGHGRFVATLAFPESPAFPSHGALLAFNSRSGGQRAILAHLYGTDPAPITRLIVFRIHRTEGTFGTTLAAQLPPSVNRWGYLKRISLTLRRRFIYRGRERSYLSAACAAPPGFPAAFFPLARATFAFADGRTLTSTITRSCRVRR